MTERKPMEPVAWRKENPAFTRYTGDGWPPVRFLWTEAQDISSAEPGWVPLLTAAQVREAVERVADRHEKPRRFPARTRSAAWADGWHSALDALRTELGLQEDQ